MIDKQTLSERDTCTKYIAPTLEFLGWNKYAQLLEGVSFTDGKIYVRGKLTARGQRKLADYILCYKPNIPVTIIEAKNNKHFVTVGLQQGLDYKTYTAFQLIHRLWNSGAKKRILFLTDRNALIDQIRRGDFKHEKNAE
jgi:type I site-specific restriction endonuclease